MRTHIKLLILLIPIAIILASCGTSTPSIQPDPSQPLTDGDSPIRAEAGPITLTPPQGYLVENGKNGISLSATGENGNMLIGFRVAESSGQSADDLIIDYMTGLPAGWNSLIDNEEISGISGRGSRYSLDNDSDIQLTGRVIALTTAERDYLIFAVMDQDDWVSNGSADFSTMLGSLDIDDTTAVAQVNLPASDDQVEIEKQSEPAPTPAPTATLPAESIPPFSGQSADGYACFSGFETGLNCILPSGQWAHYTEDNSALHSNSIFAMTSCPDGRILLADVRWITVFDGVEFVQIKSPEEFSLPDLIGCGPNGEIWLDDFEGVSLFRDNKWEFFEKSEIVKDTETVFEGLEIAPDGTAWVMAFNEVASLAPGQSDWTTYAEGNGLNDKYYFDSLSLDSDGTPYLSYTDGYLWLDGNKWIEQEAELDFFGALEVTVDQQVYLTRFSEGLTIVSRDSTTSQTMADGLSRNNIDLIESDEQARVWVTTETGVDIFDGKSWTQLRMDNSELAHTRFRHITIIGDGPNLPPTATKPPGNLTGQLVSSAGLPLGNTPISLCLNGYIPYNAPEENPCLDSVESYSGETDIAGLFTIENIPSGWYELFFIVDGVWQELRDEGRFIADQVLVKPGETTDMGQRQADPN